MMNIIPSEKWLSIEYLRTNIVALLFLSDRHTRVLGCLFSAEYGEALLCRLLMRLKEVGNAQSVQQTTDIFLTLPPTLPGEKKCHVVLAHQSLDKYTKHVRLFIQNISHAWFPIVVLEEDKYVVKHPDEAPRMHFPGVLSRTRVTEEQFLSLVRHSLRCLIAKTKIPNGVEDFLNAYIQKRSNVDHRQRSAQYQSTNTAADHAPKPAAKPPARGVPVVVLALHPMPAAVPVVDDFNHVDSASEGPKEVRSDSSLKMLDEEEELGRSTQGWNRFDCVICYCASSYAKFRPSARLS